MSSKLVKQEHLLLKQCCESFVILFSCRYLAILSLIVVSNSLPTTEIRLIGLKLAATQAVSETPFFLLKSLGYILSGITDVLFTFMVFMIQII